MKSGFLHDESVVTCFQAHVNKRQNDDDDDLILIMLEQLWQKTAMAQAVFGLCVVGSRSYFPNISPQQSWAKGHGKACTYWETDGHLAALATVPHATCIRGRSTSRMRVSLRVQREPLTRSAARCLHACRQVNPRADSARGTLKCCNETLQLTSYHHLNNRTSSLCTI